MSELANDQSMASGPAEQCGRQYFGKYRGTVTDNADPEKRARLKLRIPSILGEEETEWALPCLPFGGMAGHGAHYVPEEGALVWVEFEQGNLSYPVWTGTFWDGSMEGPSDVPEKKTFQTPFGHVLEFDDTEGGEKISLIHGGDGNASVAVDEKGTISATDASGGKVVLDADAKEIIVQDANGNSVTLSASGTVVEDKNGNKIEMAASGVTVKGAQIVLDGGTVMLGGSGGEPIIKGQSFLTLFMTHTHPTGMGPSGPPVPQGEMSTLSTKVLTS